MNTFNLLLSASLMASGLANHLPPNGPESDTASDLDESDFDQAKSGFKDHAEAKDFFEESGIDQGEFLAKVGGNRRRAWNYWWGGPGTNWAVDPNPYHYSSSRPDVSKMRWYLFQPGAQWDKSSPCRGCVETWANWNDAKKSQKFNPAWPTKFVIAGFMTDPKTETFKPILVKILEQYSEGVNLIAVDTSNGMFLNLKGANGWDFHKYLDAAHNTQDVGYQTAGIYASLINARVTATNNAMKHENGKSWNVQCIGGSLGAQACGRFGRSVNAITRMQANRITALDAAGPAFQRGQDLEDYSINHDAGFFVEAVHTNGKWEKRWFYTTGVVQGYYGLARPYGDVDFYVNGGQYQPGCKMLGCSHGRMIELWEITLMKGNEYKALKCPNWQICSCFDDRCDRGKMTLSDVTMGQWGTEDSKGVYFVPTSGDAKRGFKFVNEPFVKPNGDIDQGIDRRRVVTDLPGDKCELTLFKHPNFNGPAKTLGEGQHRLDSKMAKKIRSVKVKGAGCSAIVYNKQSTKPGVVLTEGSYNKKQLLGTGVGNKKIVAVKIGREKARVI